MNFPFFSLKPDRIDELAGLRDQVIVAETKAILLENELDATRRRQRRERRKDATDIKTASAACREFYSNKVANLTPSQRSAAIEAGKRRRRG